MARTADRTRDIRARFTPIERAVLARYLQRDDPAPQELARLDVTRPVDPDRWDERRDGVAPLPGDIGSEDLMLENAVARICLRPAWARLPQWASVSHGDVILGRPPASRAPARRRLRPRHLFTINWADSAPGFSWPEAYYVTSLAAYGVCIVTASADSPDAHGYCDFAIGWYVGRPSDIDQAGACIRGWWAAQAATGQGPWECLFDTGAVDAETAAAWASAVWPVETNDEDDDD